MQNLEPLQPINDFALIIKTLAKLQRLSKASQKAIWNRLTYLAKHVDLRRSAEVEQLIYSMQCKNTYKNKLFEACERFCSANDVCYKKPKKLKCEESIIAVRIEQRIGKVVACCGWIYSTVFSLSKCGLRHDEIAKLTLGHVDLENGRVNLPTSKLGAQRTVQLTKQCADIL